MREGKKERKENGRRRRGEEKEMEEGKRWIQAGRKRRKREGVGEECGHTVGRRSEG